MKTPIADFVRGYAERGASRLHMPGHKGISRLGCEALDITEIDGADVLGSASGIIAESERNAAELFKTAGSYYSTEGSSLCIRAMLVLIKRSVGSRQPRVLAARNVHKAFIYACALLDVAVDWIYPDEFSHLCECKISAEELDARLSAYESLPDAVYLTSPDYLGNIADVEAVSQVCHRYGLPLLVDNAHGAYLAFESPSRHPIALGADMCCDSAHKTLPALTGAAYLHVSENYGKFSEREIRSAMALFASTSPSYPTLQSLDLCNAYIADGYADRLADFYVKVGQLKSRLTAIGFPTEGDEMLKLVFSKDSCGYSGLELADILRSSGIEAEFADRDRLVLMLTPDVTDGELALLENILGALPKKSSDASCSPLRRARLLCFRYATRYSLPARLFPQSLRQVAYAPPPRSPALPPFP